MTTLFWVLVLLFVGLPTLEIGLLFQLSATIGLGPTLLIALATGVVGAALARAQGVATLAKITRQMAAGEPPADALIDGAMILFAGAVLLTPGVLTDAVGFALLLPPTRAALKPLLRRWFRHAIKRGVARGSVFVWSTGARPTGPGADVIDAEVVDVKVTGDDATGQPSPREIDGRGPSGGL